MIHFHSNNRNLVAFQILGFIVLVCISPILAHGQDANATRPPRRSTNPPVRANKPPSVKPAVLNLTVTPSDSAVQLDKTDISDKLDRATGVVRINLVLGSHTLIVRRSGFKDRVLILDLKRGENEPVRISLEPLLGALNVSADPQGALLEVRQRESNQNLLTMEHQISNLTLVPGEYEVVGSKAGYLTKSRRIIIRPGENTHLELSLEEEPKPTPEPTYRLSFEPDSAMAMQTARQEKSYVVTLTGRSGVTTNTTGTIDVTFEPNNVFSGRINGMLPGFPCRVGLVRLENIGEELSFVEAPGTTNGWGKVIIRLRLKDSKRPIHFAINWSLIEPGPLSNAGRTTSEGTSPAVPLKQAKPIFPSAARSTNGTGKVSVVVLIDESGDVRSAKATEGPYMFRVPAEQAARQWKFRPAVRNGLPVQSTRTIVFEFK